MFVNNTPGSFDAALEKLKDAGPVHMLILMRFNERARYEDAVDLPPATGRDVHFQRYLPTIADIVEGIPGADLGEVLFAGQFQAQPTGPVDERWDLVVLIRWPSIHAAHLLNMHPEYERRAAPHRRAAIADMRVILATDIVAPI